MTSTAISMPNSIIIQGQLFFALYFVLFIFGSLPIAQMR
jgi:hypothetical protein